jgi:hypothetical protein
MDKYISELPLSTIHFPLLVLDILIDLYFLSLECRMSRFGGRHQWTVVPGFWKRWSQY